MVPVKNRLIYCLFLFLLYCTTILGKDIDQHAETVLRGNGLQFIENKGQIVDMNKQLRPDILFAGEGKGMKIYLRKTGISYVLLKSEEPQHEEEDIIFKGNTDETLLAKKALIQSLKICRIDLDFVNANHNFPVLVSQQTEAYYNYYLGHCPSGINNVKAYNKIIYQNIYNNIDIVFYGGKEQGLKYDIIVRPGGDPEDIKFKYTGADRLLIQGSGFEVQSSLGTLTESIPKVYQNINGKIVDVKAEYILEGSTLNFKLGNRNFQHSVVIDPWVSYFGGTDEDIGSAVTTDASGNVIFTGKTYSPDFPVMPGSFQTTSAGSDDIFVAKMSPAGNLLWATYYGGAEGECGFGVKTDGTGNLFIAGCTQSNNFPLGTSGSNTIHQNTFAGGITGLLDAFLLMLDPSGVRLWATYYGGSGDDWGYGISVYGNDLYLYGHTSSPTSISTAGAFQSTLTGSKDVFLIKFNSQGVRQWGTYAGGSSNDLSNGIVCDASGNIYISGITVSNDLPVLGGYQMVSGGAMDAFLFKFNPSGTQLWGTYYGSLGFDRGAEVAVDNSGDVILLGVTTSTSSISTSGAYQTTNGGSSDIFITKFDASGFVKWATYLGGNNVELPSGLAVDKKDNIYICAEWEDIDAGNFPINSCAYQTSYGGVEDQFIAKFNPAGNLICATYMGGTDEDDREGISVGTVSLYAVGGGITIHDNFLYMTGKTMGGYPASSNAFQAAFGGGTDAFIDQLCINICEADSLGLDFTSNLNTVCPGTPVTFSPIVNNSCDTSGYTFQWKFTGTNTFSSTAINPTITFLTPGTYEVELILTTLCKKDSITKASFITVLQPPVLSISGTDSVCAGSSAMLSANGANNYVWSTGTAASNITLLPSVTTIYTVTGTDANGCTNSVTHTVNVNSLPIVTCSPNTTLCAGGAISITAGGTTAVYTWQSTQPGTVKTAGTPINVSPTVTTTYTVTGTDINGCTNTASVTVNVSPLPIITISGPPDICSGRSVTLTAAGANSYIWNTGNPNSAVTLFPTTTTTYTVAGTDANGCINSAVHTITVHPLPLVDFVGQDSGCAPVCVNFLPLYSNFSRLTWKFGDGNSAVGLNATHCYTTPGSYDVGLTATDNNGCSSTINKTGVVRVYENPLSVFTASPQITTIINPAIQFADHSQGSVSWQWDFGDIKGSSIEQNPLYEYTDTGYYTTRLTITNQYGCSGSSELKIYIRPEFTVYAPNTFTPNADGRNDTFIIMGTGISEEGFELYIYNRWGEEIYHSNNINKPWDGSYHNNGDQVQEDTYGWMVRLKDVLNKQHTLIGHVNVIK